MLIISCDYHAALETRSTHRPKSLILSTPGVVWRLPLCSPSFESIKLFRLRTMRNGFADLPLRHDGVS
jgi:hypothetical protein